MKRLDAVVSSSRLVGGGLTAYAAIVFLVGYLNDAMRPGAAAPNGWYGAWFDQGQYFKMFEFISQGALGRESWLYPLGYPVLAHLTSWPYPNDPFVLLNLTLFCLFVWLSWLLFRTFCEAGLALAAAIFLASSSAQFFVTPWKTSVTAACAAALLYVCVCRPPSWLWGTVAGLLAGLMFASRIADVIIGVAIIAVSVADLAIRERRIPWKFVGSTACSLGIMAVTFLVATHHFSGRYLGLYFEMNRSQGASSIWAIPFKLYGYFIDSWTFHHSGAPALVRVVPAILLCPAGLILMWRTNQRACLLMLALATAWTVTYTPFVAVTAFTLTFGSYHYAKVLFPLIMGSACFVCGAWQSRSARFWAIYGVLVAGVIFMPKLITFSKIGVSATSVHANCRLDAASRAVDGDATWRWDSGRPQQAGMYFDIDFGRTAWCNRVVLDNRGSPGDGARKLSVWSSSDGHAWKQLTMSSRQLSPDVTEYLVDPLRLRWLRLRLEEGDTIHWWSIHELVGLRKLSARRTWWLGVLGYRPPAPGATLMTREYV